MERHHYDIAMAKVESVLLLLEEEVRQCEAVYSDPDIILLQEYCYKQVKKLFDRLEALSINS